MESGCQKGIINCCYCNCFNSLVVTIFELISSIMGTILNSYFYSSLKKLKNKLDFSFTVYYINISYFGSSSALLIVLIILKKLQKIEKTFGYKFGSYSTLIYSYLSKLIAIYNVFIIFNLLSFASFVSVRTDKDSAKDILPVTNIGLDGVIDLINGTEGVKLDCEFMDCYGNEKEENLPNIKYIDFLKLILNIIFSSLLLFFNGATFSSENKRITKLIKGKIEIDFFHVENISIFNKKFCGLLNSITCYRLNILQILSCITLLGFVSFACCLTTLILGNKKLWPQTIFFREDIGTPFGISFFALACILGIHYDNSDLLSFKTPPSKRKFLMIMLLIYSLVIYFFQILGFVTIFSSQLGHSSVSIECLYKNSCDELFTIYDSYNRTEYIFNVQVHKAKGNQIIASFFLAAIPLVSLFFITVLLISFIRRSPNEFNCLKRSYEPKLFSVEENGEKVDIDLIEIVSETMKVNKEKTNNNNEEEKNKGNEVVIHTRRVKTNYNQNV